MRPVYAVLHLKTPMLEVGVIDDKNQPRQARLTWKSSSPEKLPPIGGMMDNGQEATWLQQAEVELNYQDSLKMSGIPEGFDR